jgi:hypothetical protein
VKLRKDWSARGSYFITIPHEKVLLLGWHEQDQLSVDCDGRRLVVSKVANWSAFTEAKRQRKLERDQVKSRETASKQSTAAGVSAAERKDQVVEAPAEPGDQDGKPQTGETGSVIASYERARIERDLEHHARYSSPNERDLEKKTRR